MRKRGQLNYQTQVYAGIFLTSSGLLIQLWLWGPQYDPDLHFYTRGALNWSPDHPPLYNLFLSACRFLLPSVLVPILLQVFSYAIAVSLLLKTVWGQGPGLVYLFSCLFWGLEPISSFYQLSLMSESLYLSLAIITIWSMIPRENSHINIDQYSLMGGLAGALSFTTRWTGGWYALIAMGYGHWRGTVPMLMVLLIMGVGYFQFGGYAPGSTLSMIIWFPAAPYIDDSMIQNPCHRELFNRYRRGLGASDVIQRQEASRALYQELVRLFRQDTDPLILPDNKVHNQARLLMGTWALRGWKTHFGTIYQGMLQLNISRLIHQNRLSLRPLLEPQDPTLYSYLDKMVVKLYPIAPPHPSQAFWLDAGRGLNIWVRIWWLALLVLICMYIVLPSARTPTSRLLLLGGAVPLIVLTCTIIPYSTRFTGIYFIFIYAVGMYWFKKTFISRYNDTQT